MMMEQRRHPIRKIFTMMASAIAAGVLSIILAGSAAAQPWAYSEVRDKLTDETHLIAGSKTFSATAGGAFGMSFECRDRSQFVFAIDAPRALAKKRQSFTLFYRIDDRPAEKIRMRAYTNSSLGGLNEKDALTIANAVLAGRKVVLRAVSQNKEDLDAEFYLEGAIEPIVKSALACGITLGG